jgi:hypothetical protein
METAMDRNTEHGLDTVREESDLESRMLRLETRDDALLEALRVLLTGLESSPGLGAFDDPVARGARLARELLLSRGL